MTSSAELLPRLALRLRALRAEGLAGQPITQRQLAQALSTSVPLISSWESTRKPTVPMLRRLEDYATFFATERSVTGQRFRLLPPSELNLEERARRDELLDALFELYGHIRALNPANWINIGTLPERRSDLYTAHLILLGGVEWNPVTRDLLSRIDIPLRQLSWEGVILLGRWWHTYHLQWPVRARYVGRRSRTTGSSLPGSERSLCS